MLSVENPPRDPPSCETGSDEAEPVDLLNSADLLHDNQNPKFSIRDYVFSARSKDITKNWPFSQEKLQVCLKHGVTEVLPPFQQLDALREDPSQEKCNARLIDDHPQRPSNSDGNKKLYRPRSDDDDEFVFVDSNVGCDENKLVVSGSQDFPSTTTTQSCSDADSAALPTKKTPPLGSEATNNNNKNNNNNTLQEKEQCIEKSEAVIPPPKSKPESVVKKCKFIVKLSNLGHTAGAKEKEDTPTAMNNSYLLSEAMASKVCPVCRTFSSSSNTTLNAHIDQCLCLSGGDSAATKWPGDSRVINKHRIKPRKMRSMADIYETALHCTLEELDRRNGTNWASNSSSMPAAAQETKHDDDDDGGGRSSPPLNSDDEETHNQSAVYIDANGTKLRILSKFDDPSSDSKSSDDPRPRRLLKGGKFLLAKKKNKKNHYFQKQLKLSKHDDPLGKKICSSDPVPTTQIDKDQDRNFSCEKNYVKVDYIPQQLKALGKPELIKGWVCSKRTGLTKKNNGRDDHLHSGGNNANREMQPENNQSSLCTNVKKSSVVKSRPETSTSPSNSKRIDNSLHEADSEYGDHPSPKKRFGFSAMESHGCRNRKRSLMVEEFPERSPKHLKQHDGRRRMIEVKSGTPRNVEHSVISPKMSSSSGPQELNSKSKFLFLKKRALSAADGRASGSDSKFYSKRKCSAVKKSRMQYISQANQKGVVSPTRVDRHFMQSPSKIQASVEGTSSEECTERTRTRDKKIRDEIDSEEEEVTRKNSQSPITHHRDVGENSGSLMLSGAFGCTSASDGRESVGKSESAATRRRDINIELLPSEETVVGTFTGFSKRLDPRFNGVEDDPRDMQCDSEQYIEAYKGPTSSGEQEMFCTDVVGGDENMMGKNACQIVELDSSNGQGSNYFGEVDSIPIPGPPGSFLPSPGRMDAEDIPGMSSLSSSRIQSSDGQHQELIDHSSESPISTISNSTLGRYDVKSSSENVSGGSPLLDQLRSSEVATTNVVDNFTASDAREVAEKEASFRYKNDQQPCCCSRKEIMSTQNVALNYQDSALLRRRTMAAAAPSCGKQEMNGVNNGNERSLVPEEARSSSSSMGQISSQVSSVPPPPVVNGNYESISPPTPNPVLRLMGKNLMVVNKEENVDQQQLRRTSQSSSSTTTTTTIHENSKAAPIPMMMVSSGRSQNEQEEHHNVVSQGGRFFYDQSETKEGFMQQPDMMMMMRWSTGFGNHQMASSRSTGRGLTTTSTGGGYHTPIQHLQPSRIPMKYDDDMEKAASAAAHENPVLRWRRRESLDLQENTMKEVIVIDDTPPTTTTAVGRHSYQHRREGAESRRSSGWNLNPFYINQPSYESLASSYTGPGTAVNPSFRIGTNGNPNPNPNPNPMRWNCNPEGGDVVHHYHHVHPSSLTAAAAAAATSSPARLRSELYNSSAGF